MRGRALPSPRSQRQRAGAPTARPPRPCTSSGPSWPCRALAQATGVASPLRARALLLVCCLLTDSKAQPMALSRPWARLVRAQRALLLPSARRWRRRAGSRLERRVGRCCWRGPGCVIADRAAVRTPRELHTFIPVCRPQFWHRHRVPGPQGCRGRRCGRGRVRGLPGRPSRHSGEP